VKEAPSLTIVARPSVGATLVAFARTPRFWLAALGGTALTLLVLGLPSAIIPNPVFGRTVPVRASDVAIWLASAPLFGLILATYAVRPHSSDHARGEEVRLGLGGLAVFFAIGCPVCNKLVLLALGTSGALSVFAPIQPIIGVVSLAFLVATLAYRLRQVARGCDRCAVNLREAARAA
jgi:hypothetical protein